MSKTAATKTLAVLAASLLLPTLLAWAPLAQAGPVTISQMRNFSASGATIATLAMNEFDGSLGVLTSVALSFDAESSQLNVLTFPCSSTNPERCFFRIGSDSGISLNTFVRGDILLNGSDTDSDINTCRADPGQTVTCSSSVSSRITGGDLSTDANTLALFTDDTGPLDTFDLVFAARSRNTSFFGVARVTYTYEERTAVPEPGTLAGVALGLMALTATARRRGGSRRQG
jgi:hypothetical protein